MQTSTYGVDDIAMGPHGAFVAIPSDSSSSDSSYVAFWKACSDDVSTLLSKKGAVTAAFSGTDGYYIGHPDDSGSFRLHRDFMKVLKKQNGAKWISIGPTENYIMRSHQGMLLWYNIPSDMETCINLSDSEVAWASLGEDDAWIVMFKDCTYQWSNLPEQLDNFLRCDRVNAYTKIGSLDRVWLSAFDDRWYMQYNGGNAQWHGFDEYFDKMMTCDKMLDPQTIFYTNNSISATFSCGRSVYDTARDLNNGTLCNTELPTIQVYKFDGKWFSVNNRRLWSFRNSGVTNALVEVISAPRNAAHKPLYSAVYVRYKE